MKHLIVRRIILLMSIAIILSSVLISGLGFYLSEDLIVNIRSHEYRLDLSILSELTARYIEGELDQNTYEEIVEASRDNNFLRYSVYDANHNELTDSKTFESYVDLEIMDNLDKVLRGKEVLINAQGNDMEVEIMGVPIFKDQQYRGAVFVELALFDLGEVRARFFKSLILSMFFIIIFILTISYIVLGRIVKPVRNVVGVALAMTEGDFSIKADESLAGEIGLISKSMNKLSVELYKNVSQLYIEKNRLNHVLNSLEEGMIAVDKDKNITHENDVFLQMFSLDSMDADGFLEQSGPIVKAIQKGLDEVLCGGEPFNEIHIWNDAIYRMIIEPIENEMGEIVGAVVLFRDVTDLENLEQMRKNYVANVSHELRSPLTSIQGLIEPLMDDIVTDVSDVKRYYEIIYRESLRLSRLVDDILELSRLQSADEEIKCENVDLGNLLHHVYERFKAMDQGVNFIYNERSLPFVYANRDRIEQVLVILLDNAYKFTESGGSVELSVEELDDEVWISVKDTGVGIPKEHLPFVFNRFYKSDQSRTRKSTGLGLSIAKEIMTLLDEEIYCVSEVGIGTTFKFSLKKSV